MKETPTGEFGEFFNRLANALKENTSYKLNTDGLKLVQQYHNIIQQIEKQLLPILKPITNEPENLSKQIAIQTISSINSNKTGNEIFELMSRLDTLTNGGKTPIQGSAFTFNQQDKILQYLEKL